MVYLYDACDQISDFCHQQLLRKMRRKMSWTDRGKTVYPPPPSGSGGIIIRVAVLTPAFRAQNYFHTKIFPYLCYIKPLIFKKSLKISKGQSESIYRKRTDNTMAKRKITNNDLQNIHIKLKIE